MKWGSFGTVHFATLIFAAALLAIYGPQILARRREKKNRRFAV